MNSNLVDNRNELLESISKLFIQYGMKSSSMDDIARYLKISKKTLYDLLGNKNDIVEQVVMYRKRLGDTYAEQIDFSQQDIVPYLFEILNHFINTFTSNMPNNFYDVKKYYPDIYKKHFQNADNRGISVICKFLKQGIHDGVFRNDLNKELEAYLLANQIISLVDPEITISIHFEMKDIIAKILENFIRAIATQKGIAQLEQVLQSRK